MIAAIAYLAFFPILYWIGFRETVGPAIRIAIIYIVALIYLAALLSRLQDDDRRKTRRAMQLQSWTLRQLVPRPTSRPPQ